MKEVGGIHFDGINLKLMWSFVDEIMVVDLVGQLSPPNDASDQGRNGDRRGKIEIAESVWSLPPCQCDSMSR